MEENRNQQIAKFESQEILAIISRIPDFSEQEKKDLALKVLSNDIELRDSALRMIRDSHIAVSDLINVQREIESLNKKGMYVKAKQTIKTGSGQVEIEMKGGDTKLIVPVLIIIGVAVIAVVAIVFWK